MERRRAGARRSHGVERVLSDTQNSGGNHHEAWRRMLRRQTGCSTMNAQAVNAVGVHDRNSQWRQDQSRNVLGWKDGSIRWCFGHAADLRYPLAARVSLRLTALALSHRGTRDNSAGARQRHHQDKHQNRGDGPETLHTLSISGSKTKPCLYSKDGKLSQLRMQFVEARLLLIRRS